MVLPQPSYFMEIIIMLERIYHMLTTDHVVLIDEKRQEKEISSKLLQTAILYIDSHYNERIQLEDIVAVTGSNHTTITRLFKEETGETPMEYLWYVPHQSCQEKSGIHQYSDQGSCCPCRIFYLISFFQNV